MSEEAVNSGFRIRDEVEAVNPNALNAETTYLSLTRGSGGQNLIGDELGADLGVIREQEIRAARSIDGATRSNIILAQPKPASNFCAPHVG